MQELLINVLFDLSPNEAKHLKDLCVRLSRAFLVEGVLKHDRSLLAWLSSGKRKKWQRHRCEFI